MAASNGRTPRSRGWLTFGSAGGSVALAILIALAPAGLGVAPHAKVWGPPYRGAILPYVSLSTYHCGVAKQLKGFFFHFKTGLGGAAYSASAKSCSTTQPSFGNYGSANAAGAAEISILIQIPLGIHNVSANVTLGYTATISEANGSSTGACPTHALASTYGQYYNGKAWSYWPTFTKPIHYSNKTYFYYYTTHGAQGSCSAYSSVQEYLNGYMVDTTGTAGFGTSSFLPIAQASVQTTNNTYWNCYNYTLWSYGTWANGSSSCSSSNSTTNTVSYDYATGSSGSNSSMTMSGHLTGSLWVVANFSASHHWLFFLDPSISVSCSTNGWPQGSCSAFANTASLGNGLKLNFISVK
jgi:hypothetical protein